MRALLCRTARPRIGSTCPLSNSRQTAFAPAKRKLTFNDAFTILLAPLFTAAFVADATSKDRTRQAWDRKIAAITEEVEHLHQRELDSWNCLQVRSVRVGVSHQRRTYSSSARAVALSRGPSEEEQLSENASHTSMVDDGEENIMPLFENRVAPSSHTKNLPEMTVEDWQVYEKLVAFELALEMLLELKTGRLARALRRQPALVALGCNDYPQSLDNLMFKLHDVKDRLEKLKGSRRMGTVPDSLLQHPNRAKLHRDLSDLAAKCQKGQIGARDLVHAYANAIIVSQAAPTAATYSTLLRTLSTTQYCSLAGRVVSAIRSSRQSLDNEAIWTLIYQYGVSRDFGKLEMLLWDLTRSNSILKARRPWAQTKVNEIQVAAPTGAAGVGAGSPDILTLLVKVALQCNQLQKAEAWAVLLIRQGQWRRRFGFVFRSMIQYHASQGNWTAGERWLQSLFAWACIVALETPDALWRSIFRALDLCIACGRKEEYEELLDIATSAGIRIKKQDHRKDLPATARHTLIEQDWENRLTSKMEPSYNMEVKSPISSAVLFQVRLAAKKHWLMPYIGVSDAEEVTRISKRHQYVRRPDVDILNNVGHSSEPPDVLLSNVRANHAVRQQRQGTWVSHTTEQLENQLREREHQLRKVEAQLLETKERLSWPSRRSEEVPNHHEETRRRTKELEAKADRLNGSLIELAQTVSSITHNRKKFRQQVELVEAKVQQLQTEKNELASRNVELEEQLRGSQEAARHLEEQSRLHLYHAKRREFERDGLNPTAKTVKLARLAAAR